MKDTVLFCSFPPPGLGPYKGFLSGHKPFKGSQPLFILRFWNYKDIREDTMGKQKKNVCDQSLPTGWQAPRAGWSRGWRIHKSQTLTSFSDRRSSEELQERSLLGQRLALQPIAHLYHLRWQPCRLSYTL